MRDVPVKAVIFDKGNVLTPDIYESFCRDDVHGIRALHPELSSAACLDACNVLWGRFAYSSDRHEDERQYWLEFICRLAGQFRSQPTPERLMAMVDHYVYSLPGSIELLEDLRARGVLLALCSNNTKFWSDRQDEKLDLRRFVSGRRTILSCDFGVSKSASYTLFQASVDSLGLPAAACAFVDDRLSNVEHGRTFGLRSIHCGGEGIEGVRRALIELGVLEHATQ
jgi:HAD superfamily hydrolase (TIGR01509 family)